MADLGLFGPLFNVASTFDAMNTALFTGLSTDPLIGPLAKALPAPPKVSSAVRQAGVSLPRLPALPPPPGYTPASSSAAEQAQAPLKSAPPGYNPFS